MEKEILLMENGKIITNPFLANKLRKQYSDLKKVTVIDALIFLSQS